MSAQAENHTTERRRSSATEIRTLRNPPEIWELVHPVAPRDFKPGKAFVSHLTSGWSNVLMLLLVIGVISVIGAALWKLTTSDFGGVVRPKQAQSAARVPPTIENSAVDTSAESVTTNTRTIPEPQTSTATEVLDQPSVVPSRVVRNSTSRSRVPQRASVTAENSEKTKGLRVADQSSLNNQRNGLQFTKRADNPGSKDTASSKTGAALSPQLIAPSGAAQTAKPKVIQWP